MTPLERMVDDFTTAFKLRHYEALQDYEVKSKATIKAMVECANRGIGQKCRWARARLQKEFSK